MQFSQAFQSPVAVEIGGEVVSIPRFTISDFSAWGSIIDTERQKIAIAGLTPDQRFQALAFYSLPPSTLDELALRSVSPAGTLYVLRCCLKKAGWDDARITKFIDENEPAGLKMLAYELTSVIERAPKPPAPVGNPGGEPPLTPTAPG